MRRQFMYLTINQSVREVQQADLAADILTNKHSHASTPIILCGRISMYCTSLLCLSACCLISSRFHILVWLWTFFLSFSCRLFLVLHFDVFFCCSTSLAVGLLLILLSLALLAFLLLFLLWLRRWRVQDRVDFRPQGVDLVFYLFDGIGKVFILCLLLKSFVNLYEIGIHNTNFLNDALLPFLSQVWLFTRCC